MDRRTFMRSAGVAATGLMLHGGLPGRGVADVAACEALPPPGVMLFTLRELLASEPDAVLAALAATGLQEVELFGLDASGTLFGRRPERLAAELQRNGLRAPMAHLGGDVATDAGLVEAAHALGVEVLVMGIAPEFTATVNGRWSMVRARDLDQLDRLAQRLDAIGAALRAEGLRFAYHNHHIEFLPVDGQVPFDYLMARTDPSLVAAEIDVGWLGVAGVDPVECLHRHAGRVVACHLKDFVADEPVPDVDDTAALQARLVEPGAGALDFAAVLAAMRATGVAHGFIEIDVSAEPLAVVERGHRHLQALQGC